MTSKAPKSRFENTVEDKKETPTPSKQVNPEEKKESTSTTIEAENKRLEATQDDLVLTKKEKNISAFGYISFLCVLPLCMEPKSKFCKFHGKQGMVITVFFFFINWLGAFSSLFWFIFFVLQIGLIVLGFYQAIQGKVFRIPFVANVADKLDI